MSIEQTLAERAERYGDFLPRSQTAMDLKAVLRANPGWQRLAAYQQHSLDVISDKVSRILNGDPSYPDSWHDIAGYALLVEHRLATLELTEVVA